MGVARIYRAASPFNVEEMRETDSVQSFDVMYLAHLNHDPLKLNRLGHTDWRFTAVPFAPTTLPPTGVGVVASHPNTDSDNGGNAYFPQPDTYVVTVIDAATGQESRASVTVIATNDLTLKRNYNQVSWGAVAGAERYRVYKSHNNGGYGLAGESRVTTFRDDYIAADLTLGPPEARNPFANAGDKPSTVTFFEQRLWWGRTLNNPSAVFSSRSADFENMDVSVPVRADDAITIRLVSKGVNQAYHLVPMDNLLVFTSDGLFKIEGANEDYLSASPPPRQRQQLGRGSSRLEPIIVDAVALYKTKSGGQVRAAGYRFEVNGVQSNDVTIFSPHFFEGFDIVSWAFAEEPLSILWAARSDGALLSFTWEQEHQVWGWTICPLAGNGKVKSLCSIHERGEDRIYAVIERTIAGVTRTTRERMASGRWTGLHSQCHLDCATPFSSEVPTNVIDGLWHLEGETIAAFADGIAYEGLLVAGGKVTLPEGATCTIAFAGLPFDAYAETLPLSFQDQRQGASQGRPQQSGDAVIKLVRSRPPNVGVKPDRLRPLKPPTITAALTDEASLLTGEFTCPTDPVVKNETTLTIHQRIAPLTVTAVYIDAEATG